VALLLIRTILPQRDVLGKVALQAELGPRHSKVRKKIIPLPRGNDKSVQTDVVNKEKKFPKGEGPDVLLCAVGERAVLDTEGLSSVATDKTRGGNPEITRVS